VRTFNMEIPSKEFDEKPEVVRFNVERYDTHPVTNKILRVCLQRYIVGRPNLLKLPLFPVQEDKSLHYNLGAHFHFLTKNLMVWSYLDRNPARLDLDCTTLSPRVPIKIGMILIQTYR
jgi:hypothetical protein